MSGVFTGFTNKEADRRISDLADREGRANPVTRRWIVKCATCSETFIARDQRQRWCSRACRNDERPGGSAGASARESQH